VSAEPGASAPHDPPLPSALRAPIGARLMDDLSARTDALVAAAQRTRDRTGGDAVHDLRVASRRLSEALALWRELLAPEGARRARRSLRRLRRAVGPVRELEVNLDQLAASSEEAPVIKLANLILVQAIKDRASDIHVEPFDKTLRLRYRIDGVLTDATPPPKQMQLALACLRLQV